MSFMMWWRYVAIRSWLWWISSCGTQNKRRVKPMTYKLIELKASFSLQRYFKRNEDIKQECSWEFESLPFQTGGWWSCRALRESSHWSKKQEKVMFNFNGSANPKVKVTTVFGNGLNSCRCSYVCLYAHYLVCSPVHPSLSTRVDVDENKAFYHIWVVQLKDT